MELGTRGNVDLASTGSGVTAMVVRGHMFLSSNRKHCCLCPGSSMKSIILRSRVHHMTGASECYYARSALSAILCKVSWREYGRSVG
jgi:hypothetical protein